MILLSKNKPTTQHHDILIVGAGLVGRLMAHALNQLNFRVAIVEKHKPSKNQKGDGRLLALSADTCAMIDRLGAWTQAISKAATPIEQIHVAYAKHPAAIDWTNKQDPRFALGQTLPHPVLASAWSIHQDQIFYDANWQSNPEDTACTLTLPAYHNTVLSAPLLIACDGIHSPVAADSGLAGTLIAQPYDVFVFHLTWPHPTTHQARLRFDQHSSLAFVPSATGGAAIMTVHKRLSQAAHFNAKTHLCTRWSEAGWDIAIGRLEKLSAPFAYPMMTRRAKNLHAHRTVLLGQAACALPPLAAQGFNLGIRDAGHLLDVLVDARHQGEDLGAVPVLERYRQKRLKDHDAMWSVTQKLLKRMGQNGWLHAGLSTTALWGMQTVLAPYCLKHFSRGLPPYSRLASGVPLNRWEAS